MPEAALAVVILLAIVAAVAVPAWYWDGGLIEIQSSQFVRQYLDNRSTLEKGFDPQGSDLGTYQARELSYLVDYLDARVFEASMLADRPLFVPASALVASALTVLLGVVAIRRLTAAARLPAALVLLAYVTNYVHLVTMGMLYRSAKPMLAPVLVAAIFYLLAILHDRPESRGSRSIRSRSAPLVVFTLFSVMSLLDRQGFFYAVAGCVVMALHVVMVGGRRDLLLGGLAAVAVMAFYPALIERISGYRPGVEYQPMPGQAVFANGGILGRAVELVAQSITTMMGGASPVIFALVALVGVLWLFFSGRSLIALGILFVGLVQTALVALMVARYPTVYDYFDHQVWYYPLPFQAVLLALLIALIGRLAPAWNAVRTGIVCVILAGIAVSNVAHWNGYRRAQLRSHWFSAVYQQNAALKASFADGRPRSSLSPELFAFFEFWRARAPALRERAASAGSR